MVKFGRKDVEYGIVLGFLEEFAKSASDIIRARFSADRKLPNSVERVTFKNRPSLFGTAGDDAQFHEISRWLAPAVYECGHYQDDLEDARSSRHRETCRWIEARPEFVKWSNGKDEETQSLLWIHAIPGAGKTVLASYLVDHLEKPDNVDTQPQPIFYFFCKNADTDKNNALAITKALAHQLIQSPHVARHNILKDLRFQMDRGGRSRAINFRPLFEMISQHLSILPRAIIIIDAADECSDIDQLLPRLIQLTEKGTARVVLTSRREPHLVNILQNKPGLGMGPGDVQEDIKSYLEYQVSQSGFLSDPRVRHRITRILNTRSKGMFLWVALMIKELKHCSTIEDVEYTLDRLPDGLNAVYELILTRLHNFLKPPRKTFCCRLLKWITLAKRPLRLTEVGEALKIQYEAAIDDIGYTQHLLCSTHEVESVCGSLVTVKDGIIQLIHLSTKEFLIDQERASNLRQDLHAFFVRTQEDNALLSGICVEYLSTCCIPGKLSRDDSSKGWQMDNAKLLEYAYLNWILHLNESTSETLVRQVPILQGFLASRNSLYWLEICFTIDRDIYGTLSTHLQAVLDWCLRCEPKVSGSRSPQGLVSLFHYWAKSYLQLLDDYGPSLKEWPHEVHFIDPERVFEPSSFQILESLRQNGSYHRHHVLNDPKLRRISTIVPTHRALPKYTSAKEDYSYIFVDERRQVFFTLDKYVTRAPHIYCQEITSGKRLTPIVDTELGENNHDLQTRGATLSACGRYLGIVYSWPETKEIPQSFKVNTTIYTAIWLLSEHFDFSCAGRPQWARKLISLSTTAPVNILGMQSANPIAFGGDGFVYCPHGRVDLSSGVQEPIFCAPDSREPLDVTFSGDGRTAVGFEGVSSHLQEISPKGELTTIYPYKKDIISLGALSSSGRFLAWNQSSGMMPYRCYIYDRYSRRAQELSAVESRVKPLFSKDEKLLLGTHESSSHTTRIIIWRQRTLPHILPRSETVPPLTIVPEHLKGAYITFLLGDKPGSTVRALFATIDGEFEMKYLGFTINQYLERFSAWYEESAQLRRDLLAAEAVEEDALTDYSDAGDAMSDYSDESEVSD
ncbi:MAG: hypothetical protein L6R42_000732 [Xanthoria sp. 1 TBL-2021]|nr:MAG: hypothetical protein L6R42_000732 [Xanthoria sp. 1 TBL-2021]